ncbi:MAG: PD40 domain-containing protein [Flavobacteriales bacterium]|nr:PD40 domain-containing protein [Flavobacteriales bacterium]
MRSLLLILSFPLLFGTSCSAQKVKLSGTDNKKAYELFGTAMRQRDLLEYDAAIKTLEKALSKDPNFVDAWDLKGKIHLENGEKDKARDCFEQVLTLNPEHPFALVDLSELLFEDGQYDRCIKLLQGVLRQGPGTPQFVKAKRLERNAEFARDAVKNPVPFNPQNLGSGVNTIEEEYFPGLSLDEKTLFFTRRDGRLNIQFQNEDLFSSSLIDGSWTNVKNLGKPINTEENEGAFSASADGKTLYFTSCSRRGGVGRCDIWISNFSGGKWSEPVNPGKPLNTRDWESQPALSADGRALYFVSDRPGGFGGTDIWVSYRTETGWGVPENLGERINTPDDEQFPFIHPDGVTLYFSSYGHPGMGKSDLYFSRKGQDGWSTPTNLGYPINTAKDEWNLIVNRTGETAYFSSDNREDGFGGMDIYSFPLHNQARPSASGYVKGLVFDAANRSRLAAEVELFELQNGQKVNGVKTEKGSGDFLIALKPNTAYAFEVRSEGYLLYSAHFDLAEQSAEKPLLLEIGLNKIETGRSVVINNVFFDTDKWELKSESFAELQVLVSFLNEHPNVRIEIGGHTDNTGNREYNTRLSSNRAESVYKFLISKGIAPNRLSYKGYADTVPIADNGTEEGKARNRRTEFKILGTN